MMLYLLKTWILSGVVGDLSSARILDLLLLMDVEMILILQINLQPCFSQRVGQTLTLVMMIQKGSFYLNLTHIGTTHLYSLVPLSWWIHVLDV